MFIVSRGKCRSPFPCVYGDRVGISIAVEPRMVRAGGRQVIISCLTWVARVRAGSGVAVVIVCLNVAGVPRAHVFT